MALSEAWPHKGDWVLKLEGVNSIDAAERFEVRNFGYRFQSPSKASRRRVFSVGSDWLCNFGSPPGRRSGTVEGWQEYGGPPLLEVRVNGRNVLIPFVKAICRHVDLEARRITVEVPEGLLEL